MYGDYLGEFVCGYWDLKGRGVSSFGLIFQKGACIWGSELFWSVSKFHFLQNFSDIYLPPTRG